MCVWERTNDDSEVAMKSGSFRALATKVPGMKPLPKGMPGGTEPPPTTSWPIADAFCRRWLGISLYHTLRLTGFGLATGAGMEAFMILGWVGKTNFYETVKKKEAERLAELAKTEPAGETVNFGQVLKEQWEERKREMAAAAAAQQEAAGTRSEGAR